WGSDALGLGKVGPVEAILPVMMLAILFGLSMDYQVFLVSRMHEEWARTHDNRLAVTTGQAATGRVITAAAPISIFAFLGFAFGTRRVVAEFGIGLSAAVFLDAFVLRTLLVPALMHMLGNANWWLPRRIDRKLPHLSVEPAEHQPHDQPLTKEPAPPEGTDHRSAGPAIRQRPKPGWIAEPRRALVHVPPKDKRPPPDRAGPSPRPDRSQGDRAS